MLKIMQLIDSLQTGGAEMMAVRIANELDKSNIDSHIVATRSTGELVKQIRENVNVYCINKRNSFDLISFFRLVLYVKKHGITHIHAHSNSIYFAIVSKIFNSKLKIIWHDHYGESEYVQNRRARILRLLARFIDAEIAVNDLLHNWAKSYLQIDKVVVINNIVDIERFIQSPLLAYDGEIKLLLLANFREQKNHFLALDILQKLELIYPEKFSLHLVGNIIDAGYFFRVKQKISDLSLKVKIYNNESDSRELIEKSHICLITSRSEGLPLAILEYAALGRPIVSSNVGQIPYVIDNGISGFVCNSHQVEDFVISIIKLIKDENLRQNCVYYARSMIDNGYSGKSFVKKYFSLINTLSGNVK